MKNTKKKKKEITVRLSAAGGQIEMAKEISDPAFVRRFKADMPDGELRHGKMVSSSWNDLWREGCVWSNSIALALWSTR